MITYTDYVITRKVTLPDYTEPFYVEDLSDSANTLAIVKTMTAPAGTTNIAPNVTVEYSTDKTNWTLLGTTSEATPLVYQIPANGKVYFRADAGHWGAMDADGYVYGNVFNCTGNHKVGGNALSLLYGENFDGTQTTLRDPYSLGGIFYSDTTLTDASQLLLPTTLVQAAFAAMFYGCSSLTAVPDLNFIVEIPAYGMANMFAECIALTTAPQMKRLRTVGENGIMSMFGGCTSLTTAPDLTNVTTIGEWGFSYLFYGCTSLSEIRIGFTEWGNQNQTDGWVNYVNSTGTFYCPSTLSDIRGISNIPEFWTVVNL